MLKAWLADERLSGSRLVVVTRGAAAVAGGPDLVDLAGAAVWGLVRAAQSEHPGRLLLLRPRHCARRGRGGPDRSGAGRGGGGGAAARGPWRAGPGAPAWCGRVAGMPSRRPPTPPAWRVGVAEVGTLEGLVLVVASDALAPLAAGQVRVRVRAAGVNFRDVLVGLGMYPGEPVLGGEVAGVVVEVGAAVRGLSAGDRVMGLVPGGFGPVVVADAGACAGDGAAGARARREHRVRRRARPRWAAPPATCTTPRRRP